MLETGKDCMVCDDKKFLKEFREGSDICDQCQIDLRLAETYNQVKLKSAYKTGDTKVDTCDCGRYYISERQSKNGEWFIYEECALCRNKEISERMGTYSTMGASDPQSQWREEKQNAKSEMPSDLKNQKTERPTEKEQKNTIGKIKSERSQEKENTSEKTERNIMSDNELTTAETKSESLDQSTGQELEETQPTDYQGLPDNLRVENSNSIKLLDESAKLLTRSAESLMNKNTHVDEETGATIKSISSNDVDNLVKLTMGANELMKTKLSYIRAGKDIVKELYE
jgi:hypothetical protein